MAKRKKAPVWCKIIFHTASRPKKFKDVRRMYTKGSLFCVETPKRDDAGRPIILKYPLLSIFEVACPHEDHVGSEPREDD
jgi:hypothetical protein